MTFDDRKGPHCPETQKVLNEAWAAPVASPAEQQPREARCAVSQGSEEPRPAAAYPDEELVELYQQICARVGAYNTEILIERMFEIRAELLKRLAARPNIRNLPRDE